MGRIPNDPDWDCEEDHEHEEPVEEPDDYYPPDPDEASDYEIQRAENDYERRLFRDS